MGRLADQAAKLAKSKYAPVFAQIAANRASNRTMYDTGTSQRIDSLNREVGSISAAGATTNKRLGVLGDDSATMYQKAMADSQARYSQLSGEANAITSNLMSSMEAERVARGLAPTPQGAGVLAENSAHQSQMLAGIQAINEGALTRQGLAATDTFRMMQGSSDMLTNTAKSGATAAGQADVQSMYNTYLAKLQELEGQETVTKKEKADYRYQTLLTLKERAAQQRAEAAALAQEYAYKGAVLSETQRHNMETEQTAKDRLALSIQQATTKAQNSSVKPGFNAANMFLKEAIKGMPGFGVLSSKSTDKLISAIKNTTPTMGSSGQGYSRTGKNWETLLTGGGNAVDLDSYITRVLASSGMSATSTNKAYVKDILQQYALIAKKRV